MHLPLEDTEEQHRFWTHVDQQKINKSLLFWVFFLNSKVVLQQGEEMIYVDLISPL